MTEGCARESAGSDNGTGRGLCTGRDGEGASREDETSGGCEARDLGKLCCHQADNKISHFRPSSRLTHRLGVFNVISLVIR